ncbi:hypothetical protein LOD99_15467 [Oopsacas minuta]|uniref:Uncharacterized protein n=1 Tax=Oopsacas minuta TaxID=111878 RepID=A0AAV7KAL9_9METZ|nr:hypothetical protein LOD99_15467 [Oopsacas minuta]
MQQSLISFQLARNSIQWVYELRILYANSRKYKAILNEVAKEHNSESIVSTPNILPLCPTRWLTRYSTIKSVVDNYLAVIKSSKEMSLSESITTATKANGLLDRFQKAETLSGLLMTLKPIYLLEQLNKSLQGKSMNVSSKFKIKQKNIVSMNLKFPEEDIHLKIFFRKYTQLIMTTQRILSERYDASKTSLNQDEKLETMLLSGKVNIELIGQYPELEKHTLSTQLALFRENVNPESIEEAKIGY